MIPALDSTVLCDWLALADVFRRLAQRGAELRAGMITTETAEDNVDPELSSITPIIKTQTESSSLELENSSEDGIAV